MEINSENSTNKVYISSHKFGWLPAKILFTNILEKKARVSLRSYEDNWPTPACEISTMIIHNLNLAKSFDDHNTIEIDVDLSEYEGNVLPLQNVDQDGNLVVVDDMVDLNFLHEAAIFCNLKARHSRGIPYTRSGDIIIAMNPYQWIEELYTEEIRKLYAQTLIWNVNSSDDQLSFVAPHVYETSSLAYRGLSIDFQDQSILVSGESGAGKTETVKILMSHLASIQSVTLDKKNDRSSLIVERVLDSHPLLEAFGNAMTVRNDNSSRFGKFIQLQFDIEDNTHTAVTGQSIPSAVLAGSKCEIYLLEKCRIVSHEEEERAFHIFYQLLAAPEEIKRKIWKGLENTDNESFTYIGYTDINTIDDMTDLERFQQTCNALTLIGVTDDLFVELMRAICIVMQLGNLTFDNDLLNDEKAVISSTEVLKNLAELMGIKEDLVKKSLTERSISARNEIYKVPLNISKAIESRDALAKDIYSNTFDWLVETINDATCAEKNYKENPKANFRLIGLLDIFGFESFDVNRFEQLCINYANEKLQRKFSLDIFRSVQQEYEFEGIKMAKVDFEDNADILNLIEGKMGLICVLNEECIRPRGNDSSFVSKIYSVNNDSKYLYKSRLFHDCEFGVKHYAGSVIYNAKNFVMKNMDTMPRDLLECREKCNNQIVRKSCVHNRRKQLSMNTPKTVLLNRRQICFSSKRSSSLISDTVLTKFKTQLSMLMNNISKSRTRYIRCIKPNNVSKPKLVHHMSTIKQLRCAGLVAAVTISRSAFPNRLKHEKIFERFSCLNRRFSRNSCRNDDNNIVIKDVELLLTSILESIDNKKNDYCMKCFVCGRTRTYFRAGALEMIESKRLSVFRDIATTLQSTYRGRVDRSAFNKLKYLFVKILANTRAIIVRRRYIKLRFLCRFVQCWVRCLVPKNVLFQLRFIHKATLIQTHWRMILELRKLKRVRNASMKIQAYVRVLCKIPLFQETLKEKMYKTNLENRLNILRKKLEDGGYCRVQAKQIVAQGADPNDEKSVLKKNTIWKTSTLQQPLFDESGRMHEYFRREVVQLRKQNEKLLNDLDLLQENNRRLFDTNASITASFSTLNHHTKLLSETNAKIKVETELYRDQAIKLNLAQIEIKEELKMKQGSYIAEVQFRLHYQKKMEDIVKIIQKRCRDFKLVEDILMISNKFETDFLSVGVCDNLSTVNNVKMRQDNTVLGSFITRLKSFFDKLILPQ